MKKLRDYKGSTEVIGDLQKLYITQQRIVNHVPLWRKLEIYKKAEAKNCQSANRGKNGETPRTNT